MSLDRDLARFHPASVLGTLVAGSPTAPAPVDAVPEPEPEPGPAHRRLAALLALRSRAGGHVPSKAGAPTAGR